MSVFCVKLDDFIHNHICVLVITTLVYRDMNCVADELFTHMSLLTICKTSFAVLVHGCSL